MAYYRKLPSGKHRFMIDLKGVRESQSFTSKVTGQKWADQREAEIRAGEAGVFAERTFEAVIDSYIDRVCPSKPGGKWETSRLNALRRDYPALVKKSIHKVNSEDWQLWMDDRLTKVTRGTVDRDINLYRNVFSVSRDTWKWHAQRPFDGVRKPGNNPPRTRRTLWTEVKAICRWLGYRTGEVRTKQQEVAFAYLVALRTSLRSQEILQLGDDNVDFEQRIATIQRHKTGHRTGLPKVTPLLPPALRLLGYVRGRGRYFTVTGGSRDALFRKATTALMIEDLTFHDAKAEILTRLSKKVDVLTLSRISGNKDLRLLNETYYRETQAEVAARVGAAFRVPAAASRRA